MRWIAATCLLVACAIASASDRTEPNAFLDTNASNVPQLIQEVRSNRRVCDRYERHFGKTKDALIEYFGTLHLAKLNAEGIYQIYSVDDQGIIKAHAQKLKSGTRVFADASGQPVLKASCGNAMIPGSNLVSMVMTPPIGDPNGPLHSADFTTPVSEDAKIMQGVAVVPESPIALAPAMPTPDVVTGNRNQGLSILPVLLGLGGAAGIGLAGHGGPPAVPEPASLIVIGSALISLKMRRKRDR